jgi:hypothetical protein
VKPRNREINIFNMSLLDVLCGALGAFCFLMLALFPYYAKGSGAQNQEDTAKLKQELEQARKELEQAKSKDPKPADSSEHLAKENQELKKQLADARQQMEKSAVQKSGTKPGEAEQNLKKLTSAAGSVLSITAFWDNPHADVDLWVKYESGAWDGPKKETPDGKKLIYQLRDVKQGPGFEEFVQTSAGGKYEVYYRAMSTTGAPGTAISVFTRASWLGIGPEKFGQSTWSGQTRMTGDGRLMPGFVISFEKGEMKIGNFGAQR